MEATITNQNHPVSPPPTPQLPLLILVKKGKIKKYHTIFQ